MVLQACSLSLYASLIHTRSFTAAALAFNSNSSGWMPDHDEYQRDWKEASTRTSTLCVVIAGVTARQAHTAQQPISSALPMVQISSSR